MYYLFCFYEWEGYYLITADETISNHEPFPTLEAAEAALKEEINAPSRPAEHWYIIKGEIVSRGTTTE
jgi:hypothetical protein